MDTLLGFGLGSGLGYVLALMLLIIVMVCWIILPFAIIGTKPLLRELIFQLKRQNDLLDQRLPGIRPPPK